jgi:glycosyltransferase involved in cell wall biosynthesis
VVPGDLHARTGGYGYDRRILQEIATLGWRTAVRSLDASFPAPDAVALSDARAQLAGLPDGSIVLVDGLALGAMPDVAAAEARRLALVGLVHHPLALETGLDAARAAELADSERRALRAVRGVIVTSEATALALRRYGVEPERIAVVEPGTERPSPPAAAAPGTSGSRSRTATMRLLCVATLVPRKGHALLFEALATQAGADWRLDCIGSVTRDAAHARQLAAQLRSLGLESRVRLCGELGDDDLEAAYAQADLFVLPTLHEGYGMAAAEAMVRGLPVLATRTGAIDTLIGDEAGLLVPPGDLRAFTAALAALLGDAALRARCAAAASRRGALLPTWSESGARFAAALQRFR